MDLFSLNINLDEVVKNIMQLFIALVLPIMTAWERETSSRSAGLRTFPLVSMAACTFTILAMSIFNDQDAQSKVIAGIVTGIGFIGGGAILKDSSQVSGTSTAAAIWSTGAIGIAVGLERIEIAIALSIMTFATLKIIGRVKKEVPKD
ncbi:MULTISPECIES: MgtC/SapB family protein [unclassified Colwellia]|jgi:putative Mg2+ transporter-C (MgtC) family protein|uniref:MgtC/SapB family protein n=1 Tax=unclassified Colwellia TaxID=196834 RepID=UPI000D3C17E0|nr:MULTISPECIES: MgtC/SapB family protein [unclassified Colwellia]AWB59289.1 magnesium transporter MgtC [Colwellia sp. Arc7-D]MBA6415035.1 MgtC/SapB family protein [Colwellia sp. 6M3]|tara:strand:+ start:2226 stop:2669 length:444 start_codon:yes stop_codon:yes gene_type:complete